MVERNLTKEQREKYNKLLANKGREAAEAYKSKIVESSKPSPTTEKKTKLSASGKQLKKDFKESTKIGEDLGLFDENTISSPGISALTDPNNPAFIGKPSQAENKVIADLQASSDFYTNPDGSPKVLDLENEAITKLNQAFEVAGIRSPEITSLIGQIQRQYEDSGVKTPEMTEALDLMRKNVDEASREDPRLTNALSIMEQGLMGLNAPENQALREKSRAELNGRIESSKRTLEDSIARNRVSGGASLAAMRQLDQLGITATQQAEQDVLLKNIDVQDTRRKNYADTLLQNDSNLKGAKNSALSTYGGTLNATESRLNQEKLAAGELFSNTVGQDERSRRENQTRLAGDIAQTSVQVADAAARRKADAQKAVSELVQNGEMERAKRLIETLGLDIDISKFNSEEKTAKQGGKVALYTGVKGLNIANKTADATIAELGRTGGGGGTPPLPSTDKVDAALDAIAEEARRRGRN